MIFYKSDAAVRRQQELQNVAVIFFHAADNAGQAATRQAQVEAAVVGVARARAATDADHHLVFAIGFHDGVNQRHDGFLAPIHDALAADGNHVDIGHHAANILFIGFGEQLFADQAFAHQTAADVGTAVTGE